MCSGRGLGRISGGVGSGRGFNYGLRSGGCVRGLDAQEVYD